MIENITATVFFSYQICPRQAWFYHHKINSDKEHPLLELGRIIHQESYERFKKELFIDNLLKIDLIHKKLVAEVKKSSRRKEEAKLQLAYYLYYLKEMKGVIIKGKLLFPKEKLVVEVELTPELEEKVKELLKDMSEVLSKDVPPPLKENKNCKTCAFQEICWG